MGFPKQMLVYKNEYLINYIIQQIRKGGISNLVAILGSNFKKIKNIIVDKEIRIVSNLYWKKGISSSIQCGLENINSDTQAVIMFIVDQPYLKPIMIHRLLDKYNSTNARIIASKVGDQVLPPVLYRREVFDRLMSLHGDVGGKAIFKNEKIETVEFHDKKILIDIDTIDDYKQFINYDS